MDAKRAAEVLRNPGDHGLNVKSSATMAAIQALEAWAVVAREGQPPRMTMDGTWRFVFQKWDGVVIAGEGPTPLAAVLDAMEKEGKG